MKIVFSVKELVTKYHGH